jgi:tetratricopeptide (TPR) repeat protein
MTAPVASASERVSPLDASEVTPWDAFFGRFSGPLVAQRGLGQISMPVTTHSEAAQFWFDQGLAQLFGFAHEDAIRSFKRALAEDPRLAMAAWGIAYAYGPNINLDMDAKRARLANRYVRQARELARFAGAREQRYIRALDGRYDTAHEPLGPLSRKPLDQRYFAAMLKLAADYPDDLHAATMSAEAGLDLRPWGQWKPNGTPYPDTLRVVGILKGVLARDPHHVGAQHYLIHAVEASPDPDVALIAAERLKSDGWGQPHLVHAASHIYARNGDWGAAMISGEDALHQDVLYLRRNGGTNNLYTLAHGSHNIHFEASVMSMGGRHRLAVSNAAKLHRRVAPYVGRLPSLEYYVPYELLMRTRFSDWKGVLAAAAPPSRLLGARGLWHYARGVASAKQSRIADAQRELAALIALRARVGPNYPEFNLNAVPRVLAVAVDVLAGRIDWSSGDRPAAIARFRMAVAREDTLHYDEPPPWYYPAGETLGAALLTTGRPAQAERAFRAVLRRYPGDGWALFGLAKAMRAAHRPAREVARTGRAYARAWRWADTPIEIDDLL